ncbi:hypothetical protein [Kitasatospora sp. NPDC088351]|uniref:hypothetical protein n=1 Tax=Kitasatospora sp. NPDC088351 TaxID=3155180 RepID=UPI00342C57A3
MSVSRSTVRAASVLLAAGLSVLALGASPVNAQPGPTADTTPPVVVDHYDKGGAGQGPSTPIEAQNSLMAAAPVLTRSQVLARADTWVGKNLVYNGSGAFQGYRTDCSGYASMAWKLGTPGLDTTSFVPGGVASWLGSKNDLKPGDALLNNAAGLAGHIVIFDQWADSDHNSYIGYEFTGSGVHHRTIPYPYFSGHGTFGPVRNNSVIDDPVAPTTPVYSGDVPVAGRWPGSSSTTVGVFRDGVWGLRISNSAGPADGTVSFGQAGDVPIVGDWDGVGHSQLGVYRPSTNTFAVRHDDGGSTSLVFGQAGDVPVVGNWDANGHAQMAVYRSSTNTFTVRHDDGSVSSAVLGQAGDVPVVGDWDGVGHAQMGVYRPSTNTFALRHDDGSVSSAVFGQAGDLPIVGDWSAKGRSTYGIYRPSSVTFALSGAYAGQADTVFPFGNGGTWS